MSTTSRVDRLAKRANFEYEPRVGDVLVHPVNKKKYYVVHIGLPVGTEVLQHVILAGSHRGDWSFVYQTADELRAEGYKLVDAGWDDFIWGGFSPVHNGRCYVLFKRDAGVILRAGCRRFTTYAQAARHWSEGRGASKWVQKRSMAFDMFAEARRRGWMKVKRQPPVKKPAVKKKAVRR